MLEKSQLKNYQIKAVDHILNTKKCGLFLEMGLGKTVISLTAFSELKKRGVNNCLVITPLEIAKTTWSNEIKKWEHLSNLKCNVCIGSATKRLEKLQEKSDVYVINPENLVWMLQNKIRKFDVIILDESSCFKNATSKRFKALKLFLYDYIVCLTGTPAPRHIMDLWSQIFLMDNGERLEKNISKFKAKYFTYNPYRYEFTCINPNVILQKIENICLSLKAQDYLDLPKKLSYFTSVEIGNQKLYDDLKKDFTLKLNKGEVLAHNSGVLANKLLQFCNGCLYLENGKYEIVNNSKIEVLKNIIENNKNENIVVVYNYKFDLERLKLAFPQGVVLKENIDNLKNWNEGKINLLFCNPASDGKGLNLQFGGRILVWFGLTWNLEHYQQMNARLHRQGQTKPVIINHLVAKNCIDEHLLKILEKKEASQEMIYDALKVI
jgi:SNF2 family DNA or RNA helicase